MSTDHASLLNKLYSSALLDGGLAAVLSDIAIVYPDLPLTYQAQCVYRNSLYDGAIFNHGPDAEIHLGRTCSANPFPPIALKCDMSDIASTADYIHPDDVEKTDFYDEFLKPRGELNRAFGIILHRHGDDSAFVAANLPKSMGQREEQHVLDLFRFLRPHMQGAFKLLLEVTRRQVLAPDAEFWLDQIPTSALIVSANGRVEHLNGQARRNLVRDGPLSMDRMLQLTARDIETRKALELALQSVGANSLPVGPVSLTPERQGGPFMFVLPVQYREQVHPGLAPFVTSSMPLLVTVFDPDDAPRESDQILAAAFGLTRRESLLVQHLISGASLREASDRLEISYNTGRNHLASAASKTGARSQGDIIRRGAQLLAKLGEGNGSQSTSSSSTM